MQCSECKSYYREKHECGISVLYGSPYDEHLSRCPTSRRYLFSFDKEDDSIIWWTTGKRVKVEDIGNYALAKWEAPSGKCPKCFNSD